MTMGGGGPDEGAHPWTSRVFATKVRGHLHERLERRISARRLLAPARA